MPNSGTTAPVEHPVEGGKSPDLCPISRDFPDQGPAMVRMSSEANAAMALLLVDRAVAASAKAWARAGAAFRATVGASPPAWLVCWSRWSRRFGADVALRGATEASVSSCGTLATTAAAEVNAAAGEASSADGFAGSHRTTTEPISTSAF